MKVFFISHDASQTGAPIALLRLMQELKKQKNISIVTLLPYGGPLVKELEKLGEVYIWKKHQHLKFFERFLHRILRIVSSGYSELLLNRKVKNEVAKADIIFNNTMTTHWLLSKLPLKNKRVLTYIHESSVVAKSHATKEQMQYLQSICERIYVPAMSAARYLIDNYGFVSSKISVLPAILSDNDLAPKQSDASTTIKIGLCGVFGVLKGSDLLPAVGRILRERHITAIQLHWIGVDFTSTEFLLIEEDIKKFGLVEYFTFHGKFKDINALLSQMDLFLLLSREDTFPLVVLEAAVHSIPTICFKDAGGIQDFVQDDAGVCVDFLDMEQVVDAIETLMNNRELLLQKGKTARKKVQRHLDAAAIIENLWKDIVN